MYNILFDKFIVYSKRWNVKGLKIVACMFTTHIRKRSMSCLLYKWLLHKKNRCLENREKLCRSIGTGPNTYISSCLPTPTPPRHSRYITACAFNARCIIKSSLIGTLNIANHETHVRRPTNDKHAMLYQQIISHSLKF